MPISEKMACLKMGEERLRDWGLFSLQNRKLQRPFYSTRSYQKDRISVFMLVRGRMPWKDGRQWAEIEIWKSDWMKGKSFSLWEQAGGRTSCPERLSRLHAQQFQDQAEQSPAQLGLISQLSLVWARVELETSKLSCSLDCPTDLWS